MACEVLVVKNSILKGSVNNRKIEKVEFIDKIWPIIVEIL